MMPSGRHALLLVAVSDEALRGLGDVVDRDDVFVERIDSLDEARELSRQLPFDVLVIGYPLARTDLRRYLASLRSKGSPSRGAAIILCTGEKHREDAEAFVAHGANRVFTPSTPPFMVQSALEELLGVAPRYPLRVAMRVELSADKGRDRRLCQTENVSASGMLIRTSHSFPEGTTLRFELTLPQQSAAVRGQAVVVRNTDEIRERVRGVGVRIVAFDGTDEERFRYFVNSMTPPSA